MAGGARKGATSDLLSFMGQQMRSVVHSGSVMWDRTCAERSDHSDALHQPQPLGQQAPGEQGGDHRVEGCKDGCPG